MAFVSKHISSKTLQNVEKDQVKRSAFRNIFVSSPSQIWKSRISWKIVAVVFMTILLVQTLILNFGTVKNLKTGKLNELQEIGVSAITPLVDPSGNATDMSSSAIMPSPIDVKTINRVLNTTKIDGIAIYASAYAGRDLQKSTILLVGDYGEPKVTTLYSEDNISKTYLSSDGNTYEFVHKISTIDGTYYIVLRMDASSIQKEVSQYVIETLIIMSFMSLFVTTVLMIALGHWLLEPILFMRANLIAATKDPEDPKIQPSPFDPNDEIGGAIDLAQRLINQNAENIRRIKGAAEDKIHKLAYYDTLTGLPNRTLFVQTLTEITRNSGEGDVKRFAIVTLDLDHFKDINDSMGHSVGDAILRGVGKRLRAAMPESATVSKLGEDEFAVMMPLSTDVNSARDVAERIQGAIRSEPFKVFNEQFQVRSSIGVSTYPDDGLDPDQVLKNADIALNRAKEEGRDRIREYSEDFDRAVQQRFQMLRDLRDALEKGQLTVYYQPQLDLKNGKIIGAEALIRWWKPDNSKKGGVFIPPNDFIPVAEQSGLIVPIGEWVMTTACTTAKEWKDKYGIDARIAVNVSAAQFMQGNLVEFVQKTLNETGLAANKLELEVTESVFMEDMTHTIQTLQNLHALGIELAIDDFGTGYSSLSYLRQFPIDRLKIDQSFIRNALNNQDDASIARTIVALGHALNLKVIAEGVETKDHETFLLAQGCDEVQGYRYSKPVPNEKFIEFALGYDGRLESFNTATQQFS